jgi:hypothetical protein
MDNMKLYNEGKTVPENAQKAITGGRLSGMTDINPQWRIEKLTEMFGCCGIGWKVKTVNKWIEEGANGEKSAFIDIELFIKVDGEWSDAIEGTGGASFISKEKNGMYTSDECYKMAKTDALSVACKMIGIGSDIYRGYNDSSKYSDNNKSRSTSGQKTQTETEQKNVNMLKRVLWTACKKNEKEVMDWLEQNTSFKGRDGKQVPGLKSFDKLNGKRLEILIDKTKKLYPELFDPNLRVN